MNSLAAVIDCWNDGASKPVFATHKPHSTLLISTLTRRRIVAWSFSWPPATSFSSTRTDFFSGHPAPARVIWRRPSAKPSSSKVIAVLYRETHALLDELAEANIDGTRKDCMAWLVSVPLLIIDDLGMRKLPLTAAEDLLEIVMRRYQRASTLVTSIGQSRTGANC